MWPSGGLSSPASEKPPLLDAEVRVCGSKSRCRNWCPAIDCCPNARGYYRVTIGFLSAVCCAVTTDEPRTRECIAPTTVRGAGRGRFTFFFQIER